MLLHYKPQQRHTPVKSIKSKWAPKKRPQQSGADGRSWRTTFKSIGSEWSLRNAPNFMEHARKFIGFGTNLRTKIRHTTDNSPYQRKVDIWKNLESEVGQYVGQWILVAI